MEINLPLVVVIINIFVMFGGVAFGWGKLNQSNVGLRGELKTGLATVTTELGRVYDKVESLDDRLGGFQTRLARLEGVREGIQEERNRQGA